MRKRMKRFITSLLTLVMVMTSINGRTIANATENESGNDFGYVMYATSFEEGAISINASNACINGDLLTNGTIENKGNMNHNGKKLISENESYHFMYSKINDIFFKSVRFMGKIYILKISI